MTSSFFMGECKNLGNFDDPQLQTSGDIAENDIITKCSPFLSRKQNKNQDVRFC